MSLRLFDSSHSSTCREHAGLLILARKSKVVERRAANTRRALVARVENSFET